MKNLVAAVFLTGALLISYSASAETVTVCHLNGKANDTFSVTFMGIDFVWLFGHLVEVNENALDGHLGHGDSASNGFAIGDYQTVAELLVGEFGPAWAEVFANGQFPNGECGIITADL